ncbi:MAG TPA: uracil-DNA glycosylase [Pirellulales bacterium]
MPGKADSSAKQAVRQKLEDLYLAGVTHLPKAVGQKRVVGAPGPRPGAKSAGKAVVPAARPAAASREDRQVQLDVLREQVAGCTRCEELARTRTQTVFGVGNPQARLCFFGEAPGADEDRQGEPFVGRAGQLLNRIIEACGLKREEVYILNAIKCRPPENRTPLPQEVANCRGYLEGQLEIIRPEFICCLGAVAAQMLLETDTTIGRLRGKFHERRGSQVICTYHPAYLLRNPAAKKDVWEDMKLLLAKMGLQVPVSKAQ